MLHMTPTIFITAAALAFTFSGCDDSTQTEYTSAENSETNDDIDNANDNKHEHEHDLDLGIRDFGTFTISGSELSMAMSGAVTPNTELHVDVYHISGPIPAAIRLWVGIETGVGSLKSKADIEGDHWHGHVDCPNSISTDTKIWIEAEAPDGTRTSKSFSTS